MIPIGFQDTFETENNQKLVKPNSLLTFGQTLEF